MPATGSWSTARGSRPNLTFDGQQWNYLAGSLDVVAHELTHGVTDYSSGLDLRRTSRER